MRDEHITGMLENAPLAELSEGELEAVHAHTALCAECLRAYEAARVSSLLLRESAAAEVEPSPFFQTRVLAALRERRAREEEVPALSRLWRAAGALVSSMAVTVVALAALTFTVPVTPTTTETPDATAFDPYSEEAVLVAQDETGDAVIDYDQVFATIYDTSGAGVDDGQNR